jgi:localization factor PodJL
MTETRVRDIQRKLHELGYYPGNPDGQMGPSTRAAIGKFQRASGLPVTNNPDWTTLEKLFE